MRTFVKAGLILAAAATLSLGNAGVAVAAHQVHKASGTVQLAPMQWASFDVKTTPGHHESSPYDGYITYTNFDQPAAPSDVYRLATTVPITFNFNGIYPHTLTITSVEMADYNSLVFAGSGVYNLDPTVTFDATGTVTGSTVTMEVIYTGVGAGYTWELTGTIDPTNGSISGTAYSPTGSSDPGTWVSPAGTAYSVLSYTTEVTCFSGTGKDAVFGFTIPQWGLPVVVQVHDGKPVPNADQPDKPEKAGKFDTWAHGIDTAVGACAGTTYPYEITDGTLKVH